MSAAQLPLLIDPCPVPDCSLSVEAGAMLCRRHLRVMPAELRRRLEMWTRIASAERAPAYAQERLRETIAAIRAYYRIPSTEPPPAPTAAPRNPD